MKKFILCFVALPAVFSCNHTTIPPDASPVAAIDSSRAKPDTTLARTDSGLIKTDSPALSGIDNSIGGGLTQEEMADDSVFADGTKPTSWAVAGITDVKAFKLFLKQVQLLVLNNDKEKLAALVKYPLGKSIKTEKDFINNYDRIFSKDARLSIARINFSQIFRNSKGVMSEDGKVWFSQVEKDFKIIAINN